MCESKIITSQGRANYNEYEKNQEVFENHPIKTLPSGQVKKIFEVSKTL